MVSADLKEGRGIRLESSNVLHSHRQMIKIGLELPGKQNYPSGPPPPPKEISKPKHRWIFIKNPLKMKFIRHILSETLFFSFYKACKRSLRRKYIQNIS